RHLTPDVTQFDKDWAVYLAALGGHPEVLGRLLEAGASANSALYGAARGGRLDLGLVTGRLIAGASQWGRSHAALLAIQSGHTDVASRLLDAGARPDHALVATVRGGHFDLLGRLLTLDVSQRDKDLAVELAARNGQTVVVGLLLDAGA